ncbi:MAG TPA: hypothetical protein VFG83_02325 [Kofleriaceae bacterium]|nr:hypothetical protein [Kofleriaceae bacterium]
MSTPFSPRMAAAVVIVGVASATLALGLAAIEPGPPPPGEAQAHALSDSAVGTRSLLRLLHKLDISARVATNDEAFRHEEVVAIEVLPADLDDAAAARAINHMDTDGATLVVLPKWAITPDPDHRGWAKSASLIPADSVAHVLDLLGLHCSVARPEASGSFSSPYAAAPALGSTQLITDCPELAPIIDADGGMLLGRWEGHLGEVWVLADPDLMSNHGLDDGENAELIVQILTDVGAHREVFAFDETIHGFGQNLSLRRKLLSPPLSYAALSAIVAALILVWMGSGRFGAPVAEGPGTARDHHAPGKMFLIHNTAALLLHGGHTQHMLSRYLDTAITTVLSAYNADAAMARPEAVAWLDGIAEARGRVTRLAAITGEVAEISASRRPGAQRIATSADQIYRWKREMLDQ